MLRKSPPRRRQEEKAVPHPEGAAGATPHGALHIPGVKKGLL